MNHKATRVQPQPAVRSRHRNIKSWAIAAACVLAIATTAGAEHTRYWRQSTYEEFQKGTAKGVAVRSDGKLELAPKFTPLADADASYLMALRLDPKGTVYAAGGSPAKVFRWDGSGKPTTVFESSELSAQAIAFDSKGTLFVATSPDGKVYKVTSPGEKNVFFETKTKYIWDLAFGSDGMLYIATGDKGQVYRVAPDGKGELFYASDEAHIRTLTFDNKGNLIVGTEPNGRVLRLTADPAKKTAAKKDDEGIATGFVIYETAKREVTSVAVAPDGTIYASAIGDKQKGTTQGGISIISPGGTQGVVISSGNTPAINQGVQTAATPFIPFPALFSSAIYKISPDGVPEELWNSRDDVVYALGLNADGRLLAGTGNNGALLAIDGRGVYAQLAKSGAAQITGIAKNPNGKIYLCTANPGKLISVGPEHESEGTFESQSFDAKLLSKWGRLNWWSAPVPESAKNKIAAPHIEFYVRSGNTEDPGREWSKWHGPYTKPDTNVEAPPARFAQWKAVLRDGEGDGIDWVTLAYEPHNVAPVIDGIALQDPGVRAQSPLVISAGQAQTVQLKTPPAQSSGSPVIQMQSIQTKIEVPPQGYVEQGYQSVLWTAHDDNEDELRFTVYYRGESEKDWKLLKDKLDQKFYAWDSTALPDGAYYLKIVASDAPSNPPAQALTAERESDRFVVDNTPPDILNLQSAPGGNGSLVVRFSAQDKTSAIARAQYSVDGLDWILLAPANGISDSLTEQYEITLPDLSPGEHTIAVRAYDRFENVGSAKLTIKR